MGTKKKIALIIPGGLGTGKENIGVPVLGQIVQLLSKQFDVTVFQLYKTNENYHPKGFDLLDFKSGNRLIQYFTLCISFYKVNRKKKFDAVHGFWVWPCGFLAVFLGKIFGIKSIVSVLGGDAASIPEIGYGHLRKIFSRTMILWSLRNADEATALTNYLAKNLYQAGLKRKLNILPWGVDQNLFRFSAKPLQSPVQFLHIANLHPVKDQETMLRAFEIICRTAPSHLTIIGEGIEEAKVKGLISELRLTDEVTLQGQLPYEKLSDVYNRSDILLHTSLTEGQSEVVTEAMSCGVIVCGTNVGLLYDLPDCCVSVTVKNYQALAGHILLLIKDREKIKLIQERANHWATNHDLDWTVRELVRLYK